MKSIKAIFRRGQGKDIHGQAQGQGDDISRSSSISNLNAESKAKGALLKSRKSASRDRLDKIVDKKHEKKGLTRNNNKIDGENSYSPDSDYDVDTLQKQLQEMANEKSKLALQLGDSKNQLSVLKHEIEKLKMYQEQSHVEMKQLNDENTVLRNRLRDVAHSPLSDNEKQQLLLDSRQHSSAPASIATNLLDDVSAGDITACPTPEWDKHSSSNVSEISVACLQDKINQMQETHYSTNEELQATLQELTDLQRQLTELQHDNERLLEEKNLMFDSLCRQTERLNDTRNEVESLKQLLYREKDDTGQFETVVEREQKLVELLKSTQEEREGLLLKQEQLNNELMELRSVNSEQNIELEQLSERVRTLESTLDAKHAEHKHIDQELAIAREQSSGRQIEINRLTDLLENARTKIIELEQDRTLSDKSELDEMLDNARKEKDILESEVAHLKEQLARSRNEAEKFKEQTSILQEECKVTRNNAKCTQSELEYKYDKLLQEKNTLADQLQQLQEAANELQVQAQCQQEDKRQLSSVLSETQRNLSDAERKNLELENEIMDQKRLRKEENEEWEKFQNDLLTSVRVANDFKTEAQENLQKLIMENKAHRERVRQLEAQIDKLKGVASHSHTPNSHQEQKDQEPAMSKLTSFFGKKSKSGKYNVHGKKEEAILDVDVLQKMSPLNKFNKLEINSTDSKIKEIEIPAKLVDKRKELDESYVKLVDKNKDVDYSAIKLSSKVKETTKFIDKSKETETDVKLVHKNIDTVKIDGKIKELEVPVKLVGKCKELDESYEKLVDKNKDVVKLSSKVKETVKFINKTKETETDVKLVHKNIETDKLDGKIKEIESPVKLVSKIKETDLLAKQVKDTVDKVTTKDKESPVKLRNKPELNSSSRSNRSSGKRSRTSEDLKQELNLLYAQIDVESEELTESDLAIIKLVNAWDFKGDTCKPTVNKPIANLAISKPLLTSVLDNPKLKRFIENPTLPYVEEKYENRDLGRYKDASVLNNTKFDKIFHNSLSNINYSFYKDDKRSSLRKSRSEETLNDKKLSLQGKNQYSTLEDLTIIDKLNYATENSDSSNFCDIPNEYQYDLIANKAISNIDKNCADKNYGVETSKNTNKHMFASDRNTVNVCESVVNVRKEPKQCSAKTIRDFLDYERSFSESEQFLTCVNDKTILPRETSQIKPITKENVQEINVASRRLENIDVRSFLEHERLNTSESYNTNKNKTAPVELIVKRVSTEELLAFIEAERIIASSISDIRYGLSLSAPIPKQRNLMPIPKKRSKLPETDAKPVEENNAFVVDDTDTFATSKLRCKSPQLSSKVRNVKKKPVENMVQVYVNHSQDVNTKFLESERLYFSQTEQLQAKSKSLPFVEELKRCLKSRKKRIFVTSTGEIVSRNSLSDCDRHSGSYQGYVFENFIDEFEQFNIASESLELDIENESASILIDDSSTEDDTQEITDTIERNYDTERNETYDDALCSENQVSFDRKENIEFSDTETVYSANKNTTKQCYKLTTITEKVELDDESLASFNDTNYKWERNEKVMLALSNVSGDLDEKDLRILSKIKFPDRVSDLNEHDLALIQKANEANQDGEVSSASDDLYQNKQCKNTENDDFTRKESHTTSKNNSSEIFIANEIEYYLRGTDQCILKSTSSNASNKNTVSGEKDSANILNITECNDKDILNTAGCIRARENITDTYKCENITNTCKCENITDTCKCAKTKLDNCKQCPKNITEAFNENIVQNTTENTEMNTNKATQVILPCNKNINDITFKFEQLECKETNIADNLNDTNKHGSIENKRTDNRMTIKTYENETFIDVKSKPEELEEGINTTDINIENKAKMYENDTRRNSAVKPDEQINKDILNTADCIRASENITDTCKCANVTIDKCSKNITEAFNENIVQNTTENAENNTTEFEQETNIDRLNKHGTIENKRTDNTTIQTYKNETSSDVNKSKLKELEEGINTTDINTENKVKLYENETSSNVNKSKHKELEKGINTTDKNVENKVKMYENETSSDVKSKLEELEYKLNISDINIENKVKMYKNVTCRNSTVKLDEEINTVAVNKCRNIEIDENGTRRHSAGVKSRPASVSFDYGSHESGFSRNCFARRSLGFYKPVYERTKYFSQSPDIKEQKEQFVFVETQNSTEIICENGKTDSDIMEGKSSSVDATEEASSAENIENQKDKKPDSKDAKPSESGISLGGVVKRAPNTMNIFENQKPVDPEEAKKEKEKAPDPSKKSDNVRDPKPSQDWNRSNDTNDPKNFKNASDSKQQSSDSKIAEDIAKIGETTGKKPMKIKTPNAIWHEELDAHNFTESIPISRIITSTGEITVTQEPAENKVLQLKKRFEGEISLPKQSTKDIENGAAYAQEIVSAQKANVSSSGRESFTNAKRVFQRLSGEVAADVEISEPETTTEENNVTCVTSVQITESFTERDELTS